LIRWSEVAQKIVSFSVNTTAGTRFNVAHGLGYAPNPDAVRVQARVAADDTDDANVFEVVTTDNTNIVLKPKFTVTASQGRIYIGLEENGPVNSARN